VHSEFLLNTVGAAALFTLMLLSAAFLKRSGKLLFAAALVTMVTAGFAVSTYVLS
jgi:hypothetical protein